MTEKSERIIVRIPHSIDKKLEVLAAQNKTTKSALVRSFIDAGLNQGAYEQQEEKFLANMRQALTEILDPAINRLAAISVKGGITSAAAYFLSATALTAFVHPDIRAEFNEAIVGAKKMGVQYMRMKDQNISDYLDDGVSKMKNKYMEG